VTTPTRTLTLIRHAKSSWKEPVSDFERPLNKRGIRNAAEMGEWLSVHGIRFEQILCSPARRTLATAEALAAKTGYPPSAIIPVRAIYLATADTLLDILRSQDAAFNHIALIGHNPGISSLAHQLLSGDFHEDLRTAAIVQMHLAAPSWQDIHDHGGRLEFHIDPKSID